MARMRKQAYHDYLQGPEWRAKREWALERAERRCQVCNNAERLHVHHRTYENLGAELPGDLVVLCRPCHELYHFQDDELIIEQAERFCDELTWENLNHPEPFVDRLAPLIRKIRLPTRRKAILARAMKALDDLGSHT